jgi:hypothetical protein
MKQTAVDWLEDKLLNPDVRLEIDMYNFIYKLLKQAKEMEKEQIKNAYLIPYDFHYYVEFEQYYNETFKSE